jgi:hypothetical protein
MELFSNENESGSVNVAGFIPPKNIMLNSFYLTAKGILMLAMNYVVYNGEVCVMCRVDAVDGVRPLAAHGLPVFVNIESGLFSQMITQGRAEKLHGVGNELI